MENEILTALNWQSLIYFYAIFLWHCPQPSNLGHCFYLQVFLFYVFNVFYFYYTSIGNDAGVCHKKSLP